MQNRLTPQEYERELNQSSEEKIRKLTNRSKGTVDEEFGVWFGVGIAVGVVLGFGGCFYTTADYRLDDYGLGLGILTWLKFIIVCGLLPVIAGVLYNVVVKNYNKEIKARCDEIRKTCDAELEKYRASYIKEVQQLSSDYMDNALVRQCCSKITDYMKVLIREADRSPHIEAIGINFHVIVTENDVRIGDSENAHDMSWDLNKLRYKKLDYMAQGAVAYAIQDKVKIDLQNMFPVDPGGGVSEVTSSLSYGYYWRIHIRYIALNGKYREVRDIRTDK